MLRKYSCSIFLALFFSLSGKVCAQDSSYHVDLTMRAEDDQFQKTQSIIPLYLFTGQPFEDNRNFGVETKSKAKTFNAVLPNLNGVHDTFYGYIYSAQAVNKKLPGYYFIVVGNNKRDRTPTPIWVDWNNNLDLTDDGAPDTIWNNNKAIDLTFKHPLDSNAKYILRISRFPLLSFRKYKFLLNEHYEEHSGSKIFAGADFSFREQRMNVLAGDYVNGNDSFRIAIKDYDCNGYFNDGNVDYIMIAPYGTDDYVIRVIEIPEKGLPKFEWNNKQYQITAIDKVGKFIEFKWNKGAKLEFSMNLGDKLPKFKYCTVQNKPEHVKSKVLKKKPLYLFFWNKNNPNFSSDTTALRILQREYGNKIHILCLNYGFTPKQIRRFRLRNRINWKMGYSTSEINKMLFVKEFPQSFYTDKKQVITRIGLSPSELLKLLQSNEI
jgi:hypothetical protein